MVIFGGGGDLTKRKLAPTLHNLLRAGLLSFASERGNEFGALDDQVWFGEGNLRGALAYYRRALVFRHRLGYAALLQLCGPTLEPDRGLPPKHSVLA
jgi:hypothetical protein